MKIECHIIQPKNDKTQGVLCFCKPPPDRPFLTIEKAVSQESDTPEWILIHRSDLCDFDTLDPSFEKVINLTMLCDKNFKLPLKFSLWSMVDELEGRKLLYGST